MLDQETFLSVVQHTPLVSIDLIVRSPDDGVLMGLRLNQPACGYWFVPGSVIQKNETLDAAFVRITQAELGLSIGIEEAQLLGAFTHLYDTNFALEPGVTTHYVVLAYELQRSIDIQCLPSDQHSKYRWVHQGDDVENVHENSSAYFSYLTRRS